MPEADMHRRFLCHRSMAAGARLSLRGEADSSFCAGSLGSANFRQRHRLKLAYVAGAMYKGIASKELVVRMGNAGLIGFLGTGGLKPDRMESDLRYIQSALQDRGVYGLNLLANP